MYFFLELNHNQVLDTLEIAWLAIPTLFKLIVPSQSEARDLALRSLNLIYNSDFYQDPRMKLLKAKLKLFLVSLYLFDKNDNNITIKTIMAELESITKSQKEIVDSDTFAAIGSSVVFAEAFMYYKVRKGRFLQQETTDKKKRVKKKFEEILALLKRADEIALELGPSYNLESSKIALLTSKAGLKNYSMNRGLDSKTMERVKAAINLFHTHRLKKLELTANYQYAVMVLQ